VIPSEFTAALSQLSSAFAGRSDQHPAPAAAPASPGGPPAP
jgi:hypothetical protein